MDLKYDDIQAFMGVFKAGTFSHAARSLGLTQSALSQKIARIEETLQTSVFIRHPRGLELTATGESLLIYAKEAIQHQQDFLARFSQNTYELSGTVRIAAYSSVMRSIIIPKLAPFIRENPSVSIEFSSHEMHELVPMLKSNNAELIVTDYFPQMPRVEEQEIAKEEYVIISAKKYKNIPHIFLDHGPYDNATESYFKFIGKKIDYQRNYMGEVYGIIDAVALGLGKAVMSKHLIEDDKRFHIHKEKKRYIRPVVLSFMKQNYYGPLQLKVLELLSL